MNHTFRLLIGTLVAGASIFFAGCTQQKPNSFRLQQALENFAIAEEINTRIDLLWVIDNSASMDVSQDKLRRGFTAFAKKYLRPNWDVRVAVITSDTYMAHPAFREYLRTTIDGTVGWVSPYVSSRLATFVNPTYNPNLVNLKTGDFTRGITWNDQVPAWGPDYAKLLPGKHDGPIATLCTEQHSYFFYGEAQCRIRDDQNANSGPEHCLNPADGENAITQCVNTVQNDTIHSGKPILSTWGQAEIDGLVRDFMINASVGSSGVGSERGFGSVMQFLADNEPTATAFFRPDSQRVIVFLSDENDQSIVIPERADKGFTPFTGYVSDCATKTADDYSYRLSICPDPAQLVQVSHFKQVLDQFFAKLDGATERTPTNYLVVPLVATSGETLRQLQQQRDLDDTAAGNAGDVAVDRGDRYLALASLVGNGSFAMDIGAEDYSGILDNIGRALVQRKSRFELSRAPTGVEDMTVVILRGDGSSVTVPQSDFSVEGNLLYLNDMDFVLSLSVNDRILVSYQPKSVI